MKIAIVDYSIGNIKSISNAIESIGAKVVLTSRESELESADGLILAGVGSFSAAVLSLRERKLDATLDRLVIQNGKPILGICLGLQVMTMASEESSLKGLGWLPYKTVRLPIIEGLKTPNINWMPVKVLKKDALTSKTEGNQKFYFSHSFAILEAPTSDVSMLTITNPAYIAGVSRKNIYGVQFHPEKSHDFGWSLLRNFVELACDND